MESSDSIAVIGMACRLPGAGDVGAYWRLLSGGVEAVRRLSDEELARLGVPEELRKNPSYLPVSSALEGLDLFDAAFFGISQSEAELMDPQQRIFLECAWTALEDAGYAPERFDGRIGVFASGGFNTYLFGMPASVLASSALGYQAMIANDKDYLATRVAFKLDLRGPSMTVQSACSSSLVGVALACEALLSAQADMALAGGVSIRTRGMPGYLYQDGMILSKDGHCRPFDAAASGTVSGNGAGVVVLKRLDDALAAGDTVHAVIKGWAVNNDGAQKSAFTAPSPSGQASVVSEALAMAGFKPESMQYVEAHGTGTPLGDPIEITALTQAFGAVAKRQYCAIGSVKSNLGHLDTAAGVASLMKTVLALEERQIPPSLHFSTPNPQIDLARSPFFVNTKLAPWSGEQGPRRAGVSSFGIGGTNAHMVLEEAPAPQASDAASGLQLLPISARTPGALKRAADNLAEWLSAGGAANLADVAYTLQLGRRALPCRAAVLARDAREAAQALRELDAAARTPAPAAPQLVLICPGASPQGERVAQLSAAYPAFRQALEASLGGLEPAVAQGVRAQLSGAGQGHPWLSAFVFEHALAALFGSLGVSPAAALGIGAGEYVAATLAEVMSLKDALALVAACDHIARGAAEPYALGQDADRLRDFLGRARLSAPKTAYVSSVSGAWARSEDVTKPEHWVQHLATAPKLEAALALFSDQRPRVFFELGAAPALSEAVRRLPGATVVSALDAGRPGEVGPALAGLFTGGVDPDWAALHEGRRRRRVRLPTYSFDRQRFWIDAGESAGAPGPGPVAVPRGPAPALDGLRQASPSERRGLLENYLTAAVGALLGLKPPQRIEPGQSLIELGLDSLMAVEARNRVSEELGLKLSPALFLEHQNIGALVEHLAHALEGQAGTPAPAVTPAARELPLELPLSYSQQILWALLAVLPKGTSLNLVETLRLRGPVDAAALRRAAQELVDRHPALRLCFVGPLWKAVQRRREQLEVGWHFEDLSALAPAAQEQKLEEARARSFDLKADPMLRATLLKVAEAEHLLVIACPHLVVDGWSMLNIVRQLAMAYADLATGKPVSLPPTGDEFLEHVLWEKRLVEGEDGEKLFTYWKQELDGQSLVLDVPTDHPRQPFGPIARLPVRFGEPLVQGLKALAKQRGTTLATVVLAGFQTVMAHYLEREDFVMTMLSAHRLTPNLQHAVGNFSDALPLRVRSARDQTFGEFLGRTAKSVVEALAHDGFPSKVLTDRLVPFPDPSRRPLAQVVFNWVDMSLFESVTSDAIEHVDRSTVYANDFFIIASQSGKEITGEWAYRQDLFERGTAQRLVDGWRRVLGAVLSDPDAKLSEITAALRR